MSPPTEAQNTTGSDISETVIVRGTFTMEDEYKVVCALLNIVPVSRSQYSLNSNISQTVHPIHYISF